MSRVRKTTLPHAPGVALRSGARQPLTRRPLRGTLPPPVRFDDPKAWGVILGLLGFAVAIGTCGLIASTALTALFHLGGH